jgi:hypothetical protein
VSSYCRHATVSYDPVSGGNPERTKMRSLVTFSRMGEKVTSFSGVAGGFVTRFLKAGKF